MRSSARFTVAVLLVLGAWAAAVSPAPGSEIVYVGADGNVWSASPDGATRRPVTADASAESPYRDPTLREDGTVAVLRDRHVLFVALDGTPRGESSVASTGGSATSSPPLGLDVSPAGDAALYWYLYDPPGSATPYARVTSLVPGFAGSECFLPAPCHDGFAVPKWIPGMRDFALVDGRDGSLHVVTRSGRHRWLFFTEGEVFLDYDVSRTGFRLLAEWSASFSHPAPSRLLYWENGIAPPDVPQPPRYCLLFDFATGTADVSWSPDGTAFTWAGDDGIYVSPAPVIADAGCEIRPRLIVHGGTQPDWGEINLATPAPGPAPAPVAVAASASPPAQIAAATVRALRVRPATFSRAGGARVSYRASAALTTRFTVERVARGVKRGGTCVRATRRARGRRCTHYVSVAGGWTHAATAGLNNFRFSGRVGDRRLRPGAYRMTAAAPDAAVASSSVARTLFAIR